MRRTPDYLARYFPGVKFCGSVFIDGEDYEVAIEAGAVIGEGVRIGRAVVIGAGSKIGSNTVIHSDVNIRCNVSIAESCVIGSGCIITNGCKIESRCHLEESWFEKSVRVGKLCRIQNAHIEKNCWIGDRSVILKHASIGEACYIGRFVHVGENACIGMKSNVGKRAVIMKGASIQPHSVIACRHQVDWSVVLHLPGFIGPLTGYRSQEGYMIANNAGIIPSVYSLSDFRVMAERALRKGHPLHDALFFMDKIKHCDPRRDGDEMLDASMDWESQNSIGNIEYFPYLTNVDNGLEDAIAIAIDFCGYDKKNTY